MIIQRAKYYYLTPINFFFFLFIFGHAYSLAATSLPSVSVSSLNCITLDVTATVNQENLDGTYPICLQRKTVFFSQQTLRNLGINFPQLSTQNTDDVLFDIQKLPGVIVEYYPLQLALSLTVPQDLLKKSVYTQEKNKIIIPPSPILTGLLLNYSLYADQYANSQSISGWEDTRFMMKENDSISNSISARWHDDTARTIRLDTRYQKDYPENAFTLSIGDDTTGGENGSSNLRFGGIRLSRNFNLTPYQQISPELDLMGSAVIPSNVDIYVNNVLRANQSVTPGPFEITGLPMYQGDNKIKMVLTDINGQQTERTLSRYNEPTLLKSELFAASFSTGFVRKNWGINSWDYGSSPVAIGDFAYGISNSLTVQMHSEIDHDTQLIGLGGIWVPQNRFGTLNTQLTQSRGKNQIGRKYQLGYQWSQQFINVSANYQQTESSYRDVASQTGFLPMRNNAQIFVGLNTDIGNLNFGQITQTDAWGSKRYYETLNWSAPNDKWGALRIGVRRETGVQKEQNIWVSYSLALDRKYTLSTTWMPTSNGDNLTTNLSRRSSIPNDFNGQIQYTKSNKNIQHVQASIDYQTQYGDISVGGYQGLNSDSKNGGYISAQGSMALLRDGFFLAPKIGNAFGLVSTQGIAGIPVKLENNLVGHTNKQGYLFLDTLNANQINHISLDTRSISTEYTIDNPSIDIMPSLQHGGLALFKVSQNQSVEFQVYNSTGKTLPAGSLVYASPQEEKILTQIGHDGVLYLENPRNDMKLWVIDEQLQHCKVTLNEELLSQARYVPLPITCDPEGKKREP